MSQATIHLPLNCIHLTKCSTVITKPAKSYSFTDKYNICINASIYHHNHFKHYFTVYIQYMAMKEVITANVLLYRYEFVAFY